MNKFVLAIAFALFLYVNADDQAICKEQEKTNKEKCLQASKQLKTKLYCCWTELNTSNSANHYCDAADDVDEMDKYKENKTNYSFKSTCSNKKQEIITNSSSSMAEFTILSFLALLFI